jgi:DNA modification methylase
MSALVRDYSRPGDLICDPFAGWGSTLAAAVANGRRAIGSEMDRDAFNEANRRLSRPLQVDLFGGAA